jgi:hypothetical protein
MKKSTPHKLTLQGQTIRLLTPDVLGRVAGGAHDPVANGFIMKDTIIIRTGG